MQNKNLPVPVDQKIKRKKFFLYSGAAAFGMIVLSKLPFRFLKQDTAGASKPLKVTKNPYAVSRQQGAVRNG